jgi:hypothetical protein
VYRALDLIVAWVPVVIDGFSGEYCIHGVARGYFHPLPIDLSEEFPVLPILLVDAFLVLGDDLVG